MPGFAKKPLRRMAWGALALSIPILAQAQTARWGQSSSLLPNGDVLIVGGQTGPAASTALNEAELLTPTGGIVTTPLPGVALSSHTATVLPNGKVLVAGGVNGSGAVQSTEIYDPIANAWNAGPNMLAARFGHTATLLQNGNVLLCGGINAAGGVNQSCDIYTPNSGVGSISAGPNMLTARAFHSATLLTNGGVLIAGGFNGSGYLVTTEIYNGGSFTPADPLLQPRAFHTATAMGDGNVLIAGGQNSVDISTTEVEIYNAQGNHANLNPLPMVEPRTQFAASLDVDGTVKVSGGLGGPITAQPPYPSGLKVSGSITFSGGSFSNQSLTLSGPFDLMLNAVIAATIIGGSVTFPASIISFTSGTINVNSFTVPLPVDSSTGTCVYPSVSGQLQWQCGTIAITALPPLSGTITCTNSPCGSPIQVGGSTPATMSAAAQGQNPTVAILISSAVFADEEIYTPTTNLWTLVTAGLAPQPLANLLPSDPPYGWSRFSHSQALIPLGDIEVVGGETYNPADNPPYITEVSPAPFSSPLAVLPLAPITVTQGPSLSSPRAFHTSTLLPNGKILIAGGKNASGTLNSGLLFDPNSNSFIPTGNLNDARAFQTATLLVNGNVLVAGGINPSTGILSSAEIYTSTGNSWTFTGSMNQASEYHTATMLPGGDVLVVGGEPPIGNYLNRAEIYFSTSGVWSLAAPIPSALTNGSQGLARHTATLLKNGTVLVAGGINASGPLKACEIYNPATNSWSATVGPMPDALYDHTATLLPDGHVLVAGGDDGAGGATDAVNESFLYDPVAGTWSKVGSLAYPRLGHNAVLLPNGSVMLSGGFTTSGAAVGGLEFYDNYAQAWIFTQGNVLNPPRAGHTTVLSSSGTIYDFGGEGTSGGNNYLSNTDSFYFGGLPDQYTLNAPPSLRQPQVNATNIPVLLPGVFVTVTGSHFHGVTEASGGGASSANSDQDKPRIYLQAVDNANANLIDLSTEIYNAAVNPSWSLTDSSITIQLPATNIGLPYGWYYMRVADNAQFSPSLLVHAGPPLPTSAPGVPVGTVLSSTTVSWTWAAAGGIFDGYDVYSATDGAFLSTTAVSQLSFLDANLLPNTTAALMVSAFNLSGDGAASSSTIVYTFAAVPQSLAISSNTGSSLSLGWNPNDNSSGTIYELSESTDGFVNSFSTPIPTSLAYASTQATIGNLQMNTAYSFRVRAFNYAGFPSGFSNVASTTTTTQVFNLSGSPGGTTSINWSWTSAALPPGGHFALYNAVNGALIGTPTNPTFLDPGLSTDTARSVQVAAVTGAGQGPLTSTVTVYTDAAVPAAVSPPIVAITTGGFTGVWAPGGNPASALYSCTVTGVNLSTSIFTTLTTSSSSVLSCPVSGLPLPGSFYQLQVVAINGNGIATTPLALGTTETLANPPANLTVSGTTAGSISIAWSVNANSPLDFYQITYSTDDFATDISTAVAFSAQFNQSSATITGLFGGFAYWIRAQAENQNGVVTVFSNVASTVTFNNGAPPGTLGALILPNVPATISGMLVNGENVSLIVPANAFTSSATIVISTLATSPSPCPGGVGVGISITATPPIEPISPLTLDLSYFPSQVGGLNFAQAALMRVTGINACVPEETTFNTAADQMSVVINHISQFQLAPINPAAIGDVNDAVIYPNPFYPSRGNGYVTFKNLPASARVRLFTLRGELVFDGYATGGGIFVWPGTNRGGRPAASGIYLAYIDSSGAHQIYKVAVER